MFALQTLIGFTSIEKLYLGRVRVTNKQLDLHPLECDIRLIEVYLADKHMTYIHWNVIFEFMLALQT